MLRATLGIFNHSKNINNHTITSAISDSRDSDGFCGDNYRNHSQVFLRIILYIK
jgi:hypothetical protein